MRSVTRLAVTLLVSGLLTSVAYAQAPKPEGATPAEIKPTEPAAQNILAQEGKPLTEQQVLDLLGGGVPSSRVAEIVGKNGIDFEFAAPFEQKVRQAGGGDNLVAALKSAPRSHTEPMPPEKVVLKVGDQQFTKADIDFLVENLAPQAQRAMATQGKKPLGDQYAMIVMLSQQAHNLHLDETPTFQRQLALQKQQLAAKAAYDGITQQVKVTPEEEEQYYNDHASQYDEVSIRQVVVRERPADAKIDAGKPPAPATGPGLPPEEAKARSEAIRAELAAGVDIKKVLEDFKAPGEIVIDAEPHKVRHGGMRPEMEEEAFALKPGEISKTFDLPQALVFFQVTGRSRLELKDVTPDIERTLRQQKIDVAMAELKKSFPLWMDDQYFAGPPKPPAGPTPGAPVAKTPPKP